MNGTVVQVNVSNGGVPKHPVLGAHATRQGLEGDRQAHPQFHGGPRQALLLLCAESVDELRAQGWPVFYGALGENVTIQGLDRRALRLGQRFRIGATAVVEITKLRQPCQQLTPYGEGIQKALYDKEVKAGNHHSPVWGMGGFYASVAEPGWIQPGDPVTFLDQAV